MNKLLLLCLILINTLSLIFMLIFLDQPFHNESDICPIVEYRYTKEYWDPDIISWAVCWVITLITNLIMTFYISAYHGGSKSQLEHTRGLRPGRILGTPKQKN